MGIKDILVHVDGAPAATARVELACELARRFDAHLTALYVDPELMLPAFSEVPTGPVLIDALEKEIAEQAAKARAAFDAVRERAGVAAEWRRVQGFVAGCVVSQARYADLVIVGQGGDENPQSLCDGVAEAVVLDAGRPVLVVPWIGVQGFSGKRVLVAWNASKESTRALHDALPFLAAAESVEVVSVNPASADEDEGEVPAVDICHHLARHGVKAQAHRIEATDIDAGSLLLSRAMDEGADMVVMGGYGHSRLRELVLGGVTRQLLGHMTIPVLLSH